MCKWGNNIKIKVPIPANLSYTGKFRWDFKYIDSCLVPIIKTLNKLKIYTANCCCGHGKNIGEIILHNGKVLYINKKGK